ncbi:MAG: hypothetical protein GXO31_05350 [Epsilonproteobacteria bacterium]|nr:hypothetical protein [Campylobacterota bacterium]
MDGKLIELVNGAIIESQMIFAKEHKIPLCIARMEYEKQPITEERFKDSIAFVHAFIDYNPLLLDRDNTYLLFLKDVRIHSAVKMMKKLIFSLKIKFSIKINRISVTLVDESDSLFTLMERLDRYFLLIKTSKNEKIFYGTKDFDFLAEQNKMELLNSIFKKDPEIKVYNFFKNIPLIEEARVTKFSDDFLQIKIDSSKLSFYKKDKSIYLEHNLLPDILKADIFKIDLMNSIISLYNIEFLDSSPVDREEIRVKPHKNITASVSYANRVLFEGMIVDISINSVLIATQLAKLERFKNVQTENIEFDIKFDLPFPNKTVLIKVKGKIVKMMGNQVVFTITPNAVTKSKLSSYISLRQHQLIAELEREMKSSYELT